MKEEDIACPDCRCCIDIVDSTGGSGGQHTGDIYFCEECQQYFLHDFSDGKLKVWDY